MCQYSINIYKEFSIYIRSWDVIFGDEGIYSAGHYRENSNLEYKKCKINKHLNCSLLQYQNQFIVFKTLHWMFKMNILKISKFDIFNLILAIMIG